MTRARRGPRGLGDRVMRARERDSWRRETVAIVLLVLVGGALGAAHVDEQVAVPVLVLVYGLTWVPTLTSRRK